MKHRLALELERLRRHNQVALHPLEQLFWECTLACNVHCLHCGSDCRVGEQKDMPLDDFLRVLDEEIIPNVNPHRVMIILSGGEPTLRADLVQIGFALQQRQFPWGMVTNGVAMTEDKMKQLVAAGLTSLTVSLDGMEASHNWLRQSPVAFASASRTIRLATQQLTTVDVVTCVNRRNMAELPALRDYLISLGVTRWRLFTIAPMGRATQHPDLQLTNIEYRQLLDWIMEERQRYDRHLSTILPAYACEGFLGDYEGKVRSHLYHCAAGVSVASVLADGSISGCTSVRGKYYQGNIYHDHFWQVWQERFLPYRDRSWMRRLPPCNTCQLFRYCEGNGMHLRREDGSLMHCNWQRVDCRENSVTESARN